MPIFFLESIASLGVANPGVGSLRIRSSETWPTCSQTSAKLPRRGDAQVSLFAVSALHEVAHTGADCGTSSVLISKIIQRIDQRVQFVLRLAVYFRVTLRQPHTCSD